MTNNLKILTILSIFVFILTGYFCFSSLSVKNQIIANNNNEEEKDNKEIININNRDSNKKDDKEKTSKLSILKIIIFIIFIIIAGGIFIFIFIFSKLFIFKFNESKKDFKRENFCPGFFLISKIDDFKEDADSFFETLFELILPKEKIDVNNIKEVEISLNFFTSEKIKPKVNELNLKYILDTSTTSILDPEELDDNEIDPKNNNDNKSKIINSKTKIKEMKKKYGKEFHSYLYSYLLYYLSETIAKKMNVIIKQSIYADIAGTKMSYRRKLKEKYNIDYDIMNKILKRLLSDDHSQNKNENISFS